MPQGESSLRKQIKSLVNLDRFIEDVSRIVGEDVLDRSTQNILAMLKVIQDDQTPAMDASQLRSSVSSHLFNL